MKATTFQSQCTYISERYGGNSQAIAPMTVPPDGGWGWVIVLVGFVSAVTVDGITYSFFIFREPMLHDLSVPAADFTLLSSLLYGLYYFGGILACSFANYFSFRTTMFLGATVFGLSLSAGYWMNNILLFLVALGVFGGIASGFIHVATSLPAGFYFDKKRPVVMGIISCGSGVGAAIMPQVCKQVMAQFGWRLTFLFYGCLVLSLVFLGLLIRPLKPVVVVLKGTSRKSVKTQVTGGSDCTMDFSPFRIPIQCSTSFTSRPSKYSTIVRRISLGNISLAYPTISKMAEEVDVISIRVRNSMDRSTLSRLRDMTHSRICSSSDINIEHSTQDLNTGTPQITIEPDDWVLPARKPWYKCGCLRQTQDPPTDERPLMRTDVMYTGSLSRLQEYTSKEKDIDYLLEVTKVPTYFEAVQQFTRTSAVCCCRNILRGIRVLLDYTLLKSPTFDCLALCGFTVFMAFYLPFLYAKGDNAATHVSCIGIGLTFGRISSGLIVAVSPMVGVHTIAACTLFTSGVVISLSTAVGDTAVYQTVCMVVYGFLAGFFGPLRSIIIVDFFGLNTLTAATGMMILFQGTGSLLGPPLADIVLQYTKNDSSPFYLCGLFNILASLSLTPMRVLQRWENRRKRKSPAAS